MATTVVKILIAIKLILKLANCQTITCNMPDDFQRFPSPFYDESVSGAVSISNDGLQSYEFCFHSDPSQTSCGANSQFTKLRKWYCHATYGNMIALRSHKTFQEQYAYRCILYTIVSETEMYYYVANDENPYEVNKGLLFLDKNDSLSLCEVCNNSTDIDPVKLVRISSLGTPNFPVDKPLVPCNPCDSQNNSECSYALSQIAPKNVSEALESKVSSLQEMTSYPPPFSSESPKPDQSISMPTTPISISLLFSSTTTSMPFLTMISTTTPSSSLVTKPETTATTAATATPSVFTPSTTRLSPNSKMISTSVVDSFDMKSSRKTTVVSSYLLSNTQISASPSSLIESQPSYIFPGFLPDNNQIVSELNTYIASSELPVENSAISDLLPKTIQDVNGISQSELHTSSYESIGQSQGFTYYSFSSDYETSDYLFSSYNLIISSSDVELRSLSSPLASTSSDREYQTSSELVTLEQSKHSDQSNILLTSTSSSSSNAISWEYSTDNLLPSETKELSQSFYISTINIIHKESSNLMEPKSTLDSTSFNNILSLQGQTTLVSPKSTIQISSYETNIIMTSPTTQQKASKTLESLALSTFDEPLNPSPVEISFSDTLDATLLSGFVTEINFETQEDTSSTTTTITAGTVSPLYNVTWTVSSGKFLFFSAEKGLQLNLDNSTMEWILHLSEDHVIVSRTLNTVTIGESQVYLYMCMLKKQINDTHYMFYTWADENMVNGQHRRVFLSEHDNATMCQTCSPSLPPSFQECQVLSADTDVDGIYCSDVDVEVGDPRTLAPSCNEKKEESMDTHWIVLIFICVALSMSVCFCVRLCLSRRKFRTKKDQTKLKHICRMHLLDVVYFKWYPNYMEGNGVQTRNYTQTFKHRENSSIY